MPKAKSRAPAGARIVGEVVIEDLAQFKPNTWNPNVFTAELFASLKHGLETDGWLSSQSLLIWRTDDKKRVRNIIIDGEHRWRAARELNMGKGPVVFLDGLTEVQAKALTVKLDQKRGKFDPRELGRLVREIQANTELAPKNLGVELGFDQDAMARLLKLPEVPSGVVSSNPHVKMVPLYFAAKSHAEFTRLVGELGTRFKTDNVTDTVLAAMRAASARKKVARG